MGNEESGEGLKIPEPSDQLMEKEDPRLEAALDKLIENETLGPEIPVETPVKLPEKESLAIEDP